LLTYVNKKIRLKKPTKSLRKETKSRRWG